MLNDQPLIDDLGLQTLDMTPEANPRGAHQNPYPGHNSSGMQYVQHDPLSTKEQYTSPTADASNVPSLETDADAHAEANNGNRLRVSMMQENDPAVEAAAEDLASSFEQCSLDATSSGERPNNPRTPHRSGNERSDGRATSGTSAKAHRQKLGFEEFSNQIRLERYHKNRLRILQDRQTSLQKAVALCARLRRIGELTYNGLVDVSGRGDKAGFVQVYHTMRELKDNLYSSWKRDGSLSNSLTEPGSQNHDEPPDAVSFIARLPEGSVAELLDFLHLLRTNPEFLVKHLKSLSRAQLTALSVCPEYSNTPNHGLPSASRARNQMSQHKRNVSYSNALKDCALSFERSDPISFLLFNVYGSSSDPDSAEYNLRLDVWSSVCAQLFVESEEDYQPLFNEVFKAFSALHEWRAKQRLELFLMNLLQRSAFLLRIVEGSTNSPDLERNFLDPLSTKEAESFLDEAVHDLYEILNDQDGGLPYGALHFGSAVLGKLDVGRQSSFRGYFFFQWFFCEFLRKTMVHPETQGMLLQSHVSENTRDKVLFSVWCRAWNKVQDIYLPSDSSNPIPRSADPHVKFHVEQMVSRLVDIQRFEQDSDSTGLADQTTTKSQSSPPTTPPVSLVLSVLEITRVLEALYPKPVQLSTPFDPFLNSSATAFAAQYSQMNKTSRDAFRERRPLSILDPGLMEDYSMAGQQNPSRRSRTGISGHFEQLRKDLYMCSDATSGTQLSYVCDEPWLQFTVNLQGHMQATFVTPEGNHQIGQSESSTRLIATTYQITGHVSSLDVVQRAALRLVDRHQGLVASPASNSSFGVGAFRGQSLETLFEAEAEFARNRADTTDFHYWWSALKAFRKNYPLASLGHDDTKILQPIALASRKAQIGYEKSCLELENNFVHLRNIFDQFSDAISDLLIRLERLRDKVWYSLDVMHSDVYERTKMIAGALNNMVANSSNLLQSGAGVVRGRVQARSVTGSLLERPHMEVTGVMKASTEHGGPKKLADDQVDLTRRWLQSNAVENFCRGEERIHRFCMEIRIATRKLVGEAMNESPVLWSSDLYQRERAMFDNSSPKSFMTSNNTRPASIMSDEVPYTYQHSHHGHRVLDYGARLHALETQSSPGRKGSFHSSNSSRPTRDYYINDTSSMGGSPGRAVSATTTESISSLWSPAATQAHSMTSISSYSRPASTYNDATSLKTIDQAAQAKAKFLERLRQSLTTLLLSDLGCPVWSYGSETDAWLELVLKQDRVRHRLEQRVGLESLLSAGQGNSRAKKPPAGYLRSSKAKRSISASPTVTQRSGPTRLSTLDQTNDGVTISEDAPVTYRQTTEASFSYSEAYRQVMDKFCKQSNPSWKLEALYELKMLVISHMREMASSRFSNSNPNSERPRQPGASLPSSRRSSLNQSTFSKAQSNNDASTQEEQDAGEMIPSEDEIVQSLKMILLETKPRTLFRDLQYISAFVPSEVTNKTESGQAFLHVGLAALAYKDDVCRSMVDVAAKIIATDSVKRLSDGPGSLDTSLIDAASFLTLAAKEGNAVAQRELASLYLAHPGLLQPHSLPLTLPRETFRSEMMYWQHGKVQEPHTEAMCLALHWMQHAANNGDEIARRKLMEREGSNSIR